MKKQKFRINMDLTIINKLRNTINENQNISINKEFSKRIGKDIKKFNSWDIVCAIMDRIKDTCEYLNTLELNTGEYTRSAFDFINFINNAMVVVDCVNDLANVYDVSFKNENKSTEIFKQIGKKGQGTDLKYFRYIRSLCSVHPNDTSRHSEYQDNDFECSPFVLWNNGIYSDDNDIHIVVYTSEVDKFPKNINLKIKDIFNFINYRYGLIKKIISAIELYQQEIIAQFKNRRINQPEEFKNYIEYLEYLKKEQNERLGDGMSDLLDYAIKVFKVKLSNEKNVKCLEKYKNVIKYAITFIHNEIQSLTREGYKNSGIKNNISNGTLLDLILYENNNTKEANEYSYNIQKLEHLNYDSGYQNRQWGYQMLNEMLPLLEKYVTFENVYDSDESYVLANIALYFNSLEVECELNANIPNDIMYRFNLKE